eukprot:1158922-Pelagomonas_calceolata.AAC.4
MAGNTDTTCHSLAVNCWWASRQRQVQNTTQENTAPRTQKTTGALHLDLGVHKALPTHPSTMWGRPNRRTQHQSPAATTTQPMLRTWTLASAKHWVTWGTMWGRHLAIWRGARAARVFIAFREPTFVCQPLACSWKAATKEMHEQRRGANSDTGQALLCMQAYPCEITIVRALQQALFGGSLRISTQGFQGCTMHTYVSSAPLAYEAVSGALHPINASNGSPRMNPCISLLPTPLSLSLSLSLSLTWAMPSNRCTSTSSTEQALQPRQRCAREPPAPAHTQTRARDDAPWAGRAACRLRQTEGSCSVDGCMGSAINAPFVLHHKSPEHAGSFLSPKTGLILTGTRKHNWGTRLPSHVCTTFQVRAHASACEEAWQTGKSCGLVP